MSVFTEITRSDCEVLLAGYAIGEYRDHAGLPGGVENSNFSLLTSKGRFVLTVFERQSEHDARLTMNFMQRCRSRGVPAPTAIVDNDGDFVHQFKGKTVAISSQLPGVHVKRPGAQHCRAVGRCMALLHGVGAGVSAGRTNPFSTDWRFRKVTELAKYLDQQQRELLNDALRIVDETARQPLPSGMIHGDVFRDNVLFERGRLSGIVDFHYACRERYLLDLAIALNDWCTTGTGRSSAKRHRAMLEGYMTVRELTSAEQNCLSSVLVEAALRFWLSRLHDHHFVRAGVDVEKKNPHEFEQRLQSRIREFH